MVASDSELRKINPYKGSDVDQFLEKSLSAFKIESVDILFFSHESINVFWTDHHNKIIQSLALPTKNRVKREGPKTIVRFFGNLGIDTSNRFIFIDFWTARSERSRCRLGEHEAVLCGCWC